MALYMARLGTFTFSLDTAAFQDLQRQSTYRWQAKNRIGRVSAMQFTGRDPDTITLRGVIYPHFRGGLGQVDQMRALAGQGLPLPFIYTSTQVGQLLGSFCITSVGESRTVFFENGAPRKIEFDLSLTEYGEDSTPILPGAAAAAAVAAQTGALSALSKISDVSDRLAAIKSDVTIASNIAAYVGISPAIGDTALSIVSGVQSTYNDLINSNTGKMIQATLKQVDSIKSTVKSVTKAAQAIKNAGNDPLAVFQAVQGLGSAAAVGATALGGSAAAILEKGGFVNGASSVTLFSQQATASAKSFSDYAGKLTTVEGLATEVSTKGLELLGYV